MENGNSEQQAPLSIESRARLLIESVIDYALYMLDPNGIITSWNPGAERFQGYTADEIVGQHFSKFYTEEDRERKLPEHALQTAIKNGRYEQEGWRVRKDGTHFWATVVIDTVRDQEGKVIGFAKVTRDITERRNFQIALDQAREALFQSQKMEAVGQLTGGLSHDFNNLLTGISGALDLIQTRIAQGRYHDLDRYVHTAQSAVRRATTLTHRLLAFSRQQSLSPKLSNINRLIASLDDLIRRSVGPEVSVHVESFENLWSCCIDRNQFENSLINLCLNARDAMPDGGRLTIETENKILDGNAGRERGLKPGEYISICVSDNGIGMSPEVVRKAFDPFFTTKPIGQGTGLGLSMIYGFVQQSHGQARIYSEPGHGTTVCLYFPRAYGEAEEPDAEPDPDLVQPGSGGTILIVDDDSTIRMLVMDLLHEMGFAMLEAGDGREALAILQSTATIDLLITDIGLPNGLNGRQLADQVLEFRDIEILFITGYAEGALVRNGMLEKDMHVLSKPFRMADLASKVQAILDDRKSPLRSE